MHLVTSNSRPEPRLQFESLVATTTIDTLRDLTCNNGAPSNLKDQLKLPVFVADTLQHGLPVSCLSPVAGRQSLTVSSP